VSKECFEVGGYYKHPAGKTVYVTGVNRTHMYGTTLIVESNGSFEACGSDASSFVNWKRITKEEFMKENYSKG